MVAALRLHYCYNAVLTALPCCAKLQDLLLHGLKRSLKPQYVSIASRAWGDIALASRLTSISLSNVQTASHQADVVAALTALPNLEQLTWRCVHCSKRRLSDSSMLQKMTRMTSLDLLDVTTGALQHLGSLTKLQHLSISDTNGNWARAGCPGLQELKALTSLVVSDFFLLSKWDVFDVPASVSQLTALQQLKVPAATHTALTQLQVLTTLTQLCVMQVKGLSPESPPLQLPGLKHLELGGSDHHTTINMSFLASFTQLQSLSLKFLNLQGSGSLAVSTTLQHLELFGCNVSAADGAADPVLWQQVLPGAGQLPHLTSLRLSNSIPSGDPLVQQSDIDHVVECYGNLKELGLYTVKDSFAPALAQLPGLTYLDMCTATDKTCIALVQLTGLRQLTVWDPLRISAVGWRQLAALNQLTSLGFGVLYNEQFATVAEHLLRDSLPGWRDAIVNKVCAWYCVCVWCWRVKGHPPST